MKKKIILLLIISFSIFIIFSSISVNASFDDMFYPGCITDPYFIAGEQWGLNKIEMEKAWEIEPGKKMIIVGVIDSGIDITHGDLAEKVDKNLSKSFLDRDESGEGLVNFIQNEYYKDPFFDPNGHGTHVAGIIAADATNNYGILGVSPKVTIVSLKACKVNGRPDFKDVVEAIEYAEEIGINILNFSAGVGSFHEELKNAIGNYSGLFICSAGNEGVDTDSTPHYPSGYNLSNLISVGASDEEDELWVGKNGKSNYGKTTVDLFAPGANIISAFPKCICDGSYKNESLKEAHRNIDHVEDRFHILSGTSMAAPHVAGVASLLLSLQPGLTSAYIKNILLENVDKVDSLSELCQTGGRLNAYKSIRKIMHSHTYTMKYFDTRTHKKTCSCGDTTGEAKEHYVLKAVMDKNPIYATCLGCKAKLDFRKDFASVIMGVKSSNSTTENGSYILPNGIVVLVDADVQSYINGTLVFSNKEVYDK